MLKHDVIVTQDTLHYSNTTIGNPTDTPHSTTIPVYAPPTCEAEPSGIACFRHSEYDHITSDGIIKHLCKLHWNYLSIFLDSEEQEKSA
jgi:hypothetical protein